MKKWIILFSLAGSWGAAVFYSSYIGLKAELQYACPVYAHLKMMGGTPLGNSLRLTLGYRMLNAALLSVVGLLAIGSWHSASGPEALR